MEKYQQLKNKDVLADKNPQMTRDTLFDGKIICWQHAYGYRFSIDSILVSHFSDIKQQEKVLDLGAGCGVVGLILMYRHPDKQIHITGYEKQEDLVTLAKKNSLANHYADNYQIISGDVKKIRENLAPESFSLVICNPPFYAAGTGRTSAGQESLKARHLTADGITSFVDAAAYCVKNRGRVVFIYPAERLTELVYSFHEKQIEPKTMQFFYAYPESSHASRLVIIEAIKNGGVGLTVLPPCYIYAHKGGPYSEAVELMYRP